MDMIRAQENILRSAAELPPVLMTVLLLFGIYMIFISPEMKTYAALIKAYAAETEETDLIFRRAGIKMNTATYRIVVYGAGFAVFVLMSAAAAISGRPALALAGMAAGAALSFALRPNEKIGGFDSPFTGIMAGLTSARSEKADSELYNMVTVLKNISIAYADAPVSQDRMIERLMESSEMLRPVFAEMLSKYRQGDKEGAAEYFRESIGTRNASSFASLLEKAEYINPAELRLQIAALQEGMAEERTTKGLKRAQSKGNITFALATAVCFACLINFVIVCVLTDTLEMMSELI